MGNENDANHQIDTRTVFYRMPSNTSAPPNSMQSNAPIMMSGMPPRGPHRFNANNNPGNFPFITKKNITYFISYIYLSFNFV